MTCQYFQRRKILFPRGAAITLSCVFASFVPAIRAQEIPQKKFLQHSQVIGAEKCIECHESEIKAWNGSKHYANKDLHQNEKAAEIARKMGITSPAKIRMSGLCTQCHFTVQKLGSSPAKAIDGVSCESCHGGAKDWIDIHNTGDRRESDDTAAAREKRIGDAVANGMLKPDAIHQIASNCFSCHIVTDEALVNQGGHPPGSDTFELVSWLKGEVRHNFFESKGKTNAPTPTDRQRVLYVTGKLLEMEFSMRGLARAKEKADYGNAMGRRCVSTRKAIDQIVETLGDAAPPELKTIQEEISVPGLMKFFNVEPLNATADSLAGLTAKFVEGNDGSKLGAIDSLIPGEAKGAAYHP
jgi:hypothetical protein